MDGWMEGSCLAGLVACEMVRDSSLSLSLPRPPPGLLPFPHRWEATTNASASNSNRPISTFPDPSLQVLQSPVFVWFFSRVHDWNLMQYVARAYECQTSGVFPYIQPKSVGNVSSDSLNGHVKEAGGPQVGAYLLATAAAGCCNPPTAWKPYDARSARRIGKVLPKCTRQSLVQYMVVVNSIPTPILSPYSSSFPHPLSSKAGRRRSIMCERGRSHRLLH